MLSTMLTTVLVDDSLEETVKKKKGEGSRACLAA